MNVDRKHLAGLELFKSIHKNDIDYLIGEELDRLIAQASAAPEQAKMCDCNQGRLPCSCKQVSAAPEQEPVAWKYRERVYRTSLGMVWADKLEAEKPDPDQLEVKDVEPLYTHADPSEVAQLRADLREANSLADQWAEKNSTLAAQLEAATQRVDAAEWKLTSVTEYVQGMVNAAGNQPSVATGYLRDILDALLPAS